MRGGWAILILASMSLADAAGAQAYDRWPSIISLPDSAYTPSIEAVPPVGDGPTPSIIALPNTPAGLSIRALGEPAPAGRDIADETGEPTPTVIRGGEIGGAAQPPEPAAEPAEPLLDPADRGTPAKRNALRRQAERLAREQDAARQPGEVDPSDPEIQQVPGG
jgi:hypothetical protein